MKKSVYLAGPITGLDFKGCTDWREYAAERLAPEIEAFSPMRQKHFLARQGKLEGAYDTHPLSTAKGITTRDRYDCTSCTVILMNLLGAERVSIGTMIEVGYAAVARRPIVLVMEPGNLHEHPMLAEEAGYRVQTLDEGIAIVRSILLARAK